MRILFVTTDFPTPWQPGRAPFNLALVRGLSQRHDVRVIAPVPWPNRLRAHRSSAPRDLKPDVVHPTYFYPPKIARAAYHWFYWQSIRRSVTRILRDHRPDLVLAYWAHPDGAAAVRAAKMCGAKSAIIVGGSDVLLLPRDRTRRRAVIDALAGADRVIAVSEHLRRAVIDLGIDAEKVSVRQQGVDRAIFHSGDRFAARARCAVAPQTSALLWIGRMVHVKGLDILLQAMPRVRDSRPDAQLFLVGDGSLRQTLERQVSAARLNDAVKFVGAVAAEKLGDWYRAADLTVLPSRSEGLPNVLRESLACGTPFVASGVGGIDEIARDGIDRLVEPENPIALADAILASLNSPPVVRDSVDFLSWEESADAIAALFESPNSTRVAPLSLAGEAPRQTALAAARS